MEKLLFLKVIYGTRGMETVGAYSNLQWDQQRIALDSQTNFPPRNSYGV